MQRTLAESLQASFYNLWGSVINFLPEIIIAIVVVVIGWILGDILKGVTKKLFKTLHLNTALDRAGVDTLSHKAGFQFKPAEFVGSLIKWFVIVVFAVVALDVLNLNQVTAFFTGEILTYIPRVIVAAFILLGAMVLAQVVSASVAGTARAAGFRTADMIASFTKYAILVFAVLAALNQLQIATELVQLLFAGVMFAASLAFGLAFGLGGKDVAARYLEKMMKD
jgi:small-conductance mechanosensitive channel